MSSSRDRLEALQAELRNFDQPDSVAQFEARRQEAKAQLAAARRDVDEAEDRVERLRGHRRAAMERVSVAQLDVSRQGGRLGGETAWLGSVALTGIIVGACAVISGLVGRIAGHEVGEATGRLIGLVPIAVSIGLTLRDAWRRR